MLLEVQWAQHGYTTLFLSSRNICMCAFVWLPELINVFSEIKVFKCFLCASAPNDTGREATGGPSTGASHEAASIYMYVC